MISEKKINYYLHFAENSCNEECQKIITQLVDEIQKLNAEAKVLSFRSCCPHPENDCPVPEPNDTEFCVRCKREEARKVVEKNDS